MNLHRFMEEKKFSGLKAKSDMKCFPFPLLGTWYNNRRSVLLPHGKQSFFRPAQTVKIGHRRRKQGRGRTSPPPKSPAPHPFKIAEPSGRQLLPF